MSLIENCHPFLEPGEEVRYAFMGETGVSRGLEGFGWVPGMDDAVNMVFLFANKTRIVAITDRRIAVFSTGRWFKQRQKPKSLLQSLPRATRLDHGQKRRSKITIGDQTTRVERPVYGVLDKANAEIDGATVAS